MKVGVIGLGLIGGSIAKELKHRGFATKIKGVDLNAANAKAALELGLIDEFAGDGPGSFNLNDLILFLEDIELIIVAIPVDAARKFVPEILDHLSSKQVLMDVGSTKVGICSAVSGRSNRKQFVATHPIAGTENSGPRAAHVGLFEGKIGIVCDAEESSSEALGIVQKIYNMLGMRIIRMDSAQHDQHISYVSHLSHISSFALALTVLDKEKDERLIFNMAGSGFESTVRLAKSSSEMWSPIFQQNKDFLAKALDEYIERLLAFKQDILEKNDNSLKMMMLDANRVRKILDGQDKNEVKLDLIDE